MNDRSIVGTCCAEPALSLSKDPAVWNRNVFGHTGRGRAQHLLTENMTLGTEHPRFPDLTLGRSTFKRAAVVDIYGGGAGEVIMARPFDQAQESLPQQQFLQ
jgi:hypothetical protein